MSARAWRYCTEVLDVYIRSVFFSLPLPCVALAALPCCSILRRGVWTNVGWKQCCRIDWFGVERVHVHDMVRLHIISIVPFVFLSSNTWCLAWLCRWLGGKKVFLAVPYQVKACVFVGLLYSIVGTLPSLIMKYDLPCSECNTEEWWCKIIFLLRILLLFVTRVLFSTWCLSTGKGPLCAINRSSIFFLLSLQIHLCDLVRSLYVDITVGNQRKSQGLIWKVLSVGIPCLLMAISYGGLVEFIIVCYGSLMVSSFLMTNACHQLNVARTARQARTINSMWRGTHFRAQWGLVPYWIRPFWCSCMRIMPSSYQTLKCICFVWWCQVFQHGYRMGWVSFASSFWVSSLSPLCATFMGDAQSASVSAKKD